MKTKMKALYFCISLLLTGFCFSSCSRDEEDFRFSGSNVGALNLQIPAIDQSSPIIITRAADFTMLDPANFVIEIYKAEEESCYKRFETFTDMQEEGTPLELPVGGYVIKAFSCDPLSVEQGTPYFYGEAELQIEAHEISRVEVECKYESVGVEIVLTDAFLAFFKDTYTVSVEQDNGTSAIVTKENRERIYFTNDCLYLKVTVECTTRNDVTYPPRVYYFNRDGEDPNFDGDGPFRGEYFIITVDTDKVVGKSL